MTIKLKLCAALVTATMVGTVNAQPLQQELKHLVDTHPLLKASGYAIDAAEQRSMAAQRARLPKLKLTGRKGREAIDSESYLPDDKFILGNTGTGPAQFSDLSTTKYGISAEMPIWHGGAIYNRIERTELETDLSKLNEASITQSVLLEGITAYLQVARFMTLIELTKENERSTQKQLELERKRVEAGGGVEVDAMQAKTRLQIVRERAVFYRQALRDAMTNYEQVFGRAPVLNELEALNIFTQALPADIEEAIAQLNNLSPDIKISNTQVEIADTTVEQAKSAYLPKFDLVASRNESENDNMLSSRTDKFFGVRMNWEFSLGGESIYAKRAAASSLQEQKQKNLNVRNKVTEAVRIAWNQVENGQERVDLLTDAAEISESVMLNRKKLRDAGKETALSVLDAEVEYYGVLASRVNSVYDTRINSYRLLAAIGKLTPEMIGLNGEFKLPVKPLSADLAK